MSCQQSSEISALDKVEGHVNIVENATKEVKERVEISDDEEHIKAEDSRIEVGVNEENIVAEKDKLVIGREKDHKRQDFRLEDNALLQKKGVEKGAETVPLQENVVCNVKVIGDALQGILGLVPRALVDGSDNDCTISGNNDGFALWQGHEVDLEFVDLLELINKNYPETFEHFTPKSEIFYSMGLNMLCSSVKAFAKVSASEVTLATITKYRNLFTDLKILGFNISWLVNRLNWVEEIRFSQPLFEELCVIEKRIEASKRELQELQDIRLAKMEEIQVVYGSLGSKLVSSNLADGLFSGS